MRDAVYDVVEFMRAMGQSVRDRPSLTTPAEAALRAELIAEEAAETVQALESGDLVGIADGCIDLIYVAIGCLAAHGIEPSCVWDEVHRANMAKTSGPTRADGKKLKPPGWEPPDVAGALDAQPGLNAAYPTGSRRLLPLIQWAEQFSARAEFERNRLLNAVVRRDPSGDGPDPHTVHLAPTRSFPTRGEADRYVDAVVRRLAADDVTQE